jgi:hypothetical protein
MNIKMKAIKRKHKKAKERRKMLAAASRENAKSKTRERWLKTGSIPVYRV